MTDPTTQQPPRIEGVKYRKVRLFRNETTVIDGIPSTRRVGYDGWEPVPPREWDELILRGVTGVAIGFTAIAIAGGTASLGGLLDPLVPSVVAYGMGSVFAVAWLYCLGIEWLNRTSPDRARPAMVAGWFFLLLSMGAVAAYGHTRHQEWAGAFGACVDLVSKGAWWLLLREHAVPLDAGVAHWVQDEEQRIAGRALLAGRVRRLNRRAAYQRAVGGDSYRVADAILTRAEAVHSLPEAPAAPAAPAEPAQAAPASPPVRQAEPVTAPMPPAPSAGGEQPTAPVPPVTEITRESIAAVCRAVIAANPKVTDAELVAAVKAAGHPDRSTLADTVRRSALRIDPSRKAS